MPGVVLYVQAVAIYVCIIQNTKTQIMKKLFFAVCMFIFVAAAHSQATKQPTASKGKPVEVSAIKKADTVKAAASISDTTAPKLITVQGTIEGFQALMQALDASNASHVIIEQLKQWIIPQVNEQLKKEPPKK